MKEEEAKKYLRIMKDVELWNIGYIYGGEAIDTILQSIKEKDNKIKELDTQLDFLGEQNKYIDKLEKMIKEKDKMIKKYKEAFKKLKPIAKCAYWNYENHTCTHTCRDCDCLDDKNPVSETGILVNGNRYCKLYEDGYAEEDTEFITNIDELLNIINFENKAKENKDDN